MRCLGQSGQGEVLAAMSRSCSTSSIIRQRWKFSSKTKTKSLQMQDKDHDRGGAKSQRIRSTNPGSGKMQAGDGISLKLRLAGFFDFHAVNALIESEINAVWQNGVH
jgi:hypothetical protein